jgi:hypothetical protein
MQRLQDYAQKNNMSTDQLFEFMKDWGKVSDESSHGGAFTAKEKYGMLKDEQDVSNRE